MMPELPDLKSANPRRVSTTTDTLSAESSAADPVQQYGLAVLLQGRGVSEVYTLVEAGLRWMKGQGIKAEQMERLRGYRDVLEAAHKTRMSEDGHELPVYVVAQSNSGCQGAVDLISVADAATELGVTPRQMRRIAHISQLGRRVGNSWALDRGAVLALRQQRKRGA